MLGLASGAVMRVLHYGCIMLAACSGYEVAKSMMNNDKSACALCICVNWHYLPASTRRACTREMSGSIAEQQRGASGAAATCTTSRCQRYASDVLMDAARG